MKFSMIALLLVWPALLFGAETDNKAALGDLKSIKIVCDVNVGDAGLLLRRLELIDETVTQILDAGVSVTVVVAFRGGASRYITTGGNYVASEDVEIKKEIQGWIEQFHRNGFRIEQCAIAARALKIDIGDFLPPVHVVQNGYVSLVAYQNRGYALLPMD